MKKTKLIKALAAALTASMLLTGCSAVEEIFEEAEDELEELEEDDDDEDETEEEPEESEEEDDEDESDVTETETTVMTTAPARDVVDTDDTPDTDGTYSGTIFLTEDVYGNEVGPEIFTENKVTVVNCWGTYCSPCIEEMPELEEWYQEELAAGSGVGIVGLVIDVDSSTAYMATDVMDETGVTYPNLIIDDGLYEMFCKDLYCVPTTFIVDQYGNIVAGPFEGAYVQGYKDAVENYLN